MRRVVLGIVVVALGAAGCGWLAPRPGFGPNLTVTVAPPGPGGDRVVDVTAADLAAGTSAATTVRLDGRRGAVVATGTTLPLRFTLDGDAAARGVHALYVETRLDHERRRGLAVFDTFVRLNQMQALGTHNSYHTYPQPPIDGIEALQYFEDPLDVQLQDQGVRQFELDVSVNEDPAGTFAVIHIQGVDEGTTCRAFVDCLTTIRAWSNAHPQHAPIAVLLELKNADIPFPDLPYQEWTPADLDTLDATIRSVFPEREVFTPDDLRRGAATLPDAIATRGWPAIDAVRGQVMFLMDNSGTFRDWYRTGHPALAGRVLFTNANPGDDDAAFVKRNNPTDGFANIQSLVRSGYVVRTRADADTWEARANDTGPRDAALASGATWVSSDFVVPGRAFGTPYVVQIPGGTPARCNPLNTPSWCTSAMVESLP